MKKILVIVLALVLCFALAACGGGGGGGGSSDGGGAAVSGDTFATDNLSLVVPKGWMAFNSYKMGSSEDVDHDIINIHKGAKTEWDMLSTPGMNIQVNNQDSLDMMMGFYDGAEDWGPKDIGGKSWKGFTAASLDYPITAMSAKFGDKYVIIVVWMEMGGKSVTMDDNDVQAIIGSIEVL